MRSLPPHGEQLKEFQKRRIPIPGDNCITGKTLCDDFPRFQPSEEIYQIGTDENSITTNQGIPVGGIVDGKNIEVNGTYRITIPVLFKNCNFKMGNGARIIFENSSATHIRFYFCKFFSCDQMWEGIRVEASAASNQFIFSGCHIEDAFKAITIKETGVVAILNSKFVNNYIGITNLKQNGSAINASITGNIFMATAALRPLTPAFIAEILANSLPDCGIYFVKTSATIGQAGSAFINLFTCINNGIYAINCAILSRNNHFDFLGQGSFLGTGITALDGSMRVKDACKFTDISAFGIDASGAELTAEYNDFMGDMFIGISSVGNTNGELINIHNNNMNLTGPNCFQGITVGRSENVSGMLLPSHTMINDNFIEISLPSTALYPFACIYAGTEYGIATDEMQILRNTIRINNVTPQAHGIWVIEGTSNDNIRIESNDIGYSNTTSATNYGILIEGLNPVGGINHSVRNNFVTGTTGNFPGWCGIHTVSGRNIEYCNNTIDDTRNGMHFIWDNVVALKGNNFNRHDKGLWIWTDVSTITTLPAYIGVQTRRSNEWLGAIGDYVQWAAHCENCNNALLSRFTIETNAQPLFPFPSKIKPTISGSPSDWFRTIGGDLESCSPESGARQMEDPFEEKVIDGTSGLPPSMQWEWERQLLLKKYLYPVAQMTDIQTAFYNGLQGSSAEAYAQVMQKVIDAGRVTTEQQQTIEDYRAVIRQKMQEWEELSNAHIADDPENPSQEYIDAAEALFPALTEATQNEQNWEATHEEERHNALLEARAMNEALPAEEVWMQARKLLYKITIDRLLGDPVSESEYNQLLELAAANAATVGDAKIDALRYLYPWDAAPYRTAMEHNESEVRSQPEALESVASETFMAMPNPSSGLVQVLLPKGTMDSALQVWNGSGKMILERRLFTDGSISIDLSQQPGGLYLLALWDYQKGTKNLLKVAIKR